MEQFGECGTEKEVQLEHKGKAMESNIKQSGVITEKMLPNLDVC